METATARALQTPVYGPEAEVQALNYSFISSTLRDFHHSNASHRAIIGEFGSGKTSAAGIEVGWFIARDMYKWFKIRKTRGVVVRNIYSELIDNTLEPLKYWFPWGEWHDGRKTFTLQHKTIIDGEAVELEIEMLFRACDRPDQVKKFKSLNVTWCWIDESSEINDKIKTILMGRTGRFPHRFLDPVTGESKPCPLSFFVETSNPPDIEQPLYTDYHWNRPPPGPVPSKAPKKDYEGFWQYPGENERNLKPGYYAGLKEDFRDQPDMLARYLRGEPGIMIQGKLVYANFDRNYHVAKEPLVWCKGVIYRGWDNTGNQPACIIGQVPTAQQAQVLREYWSDRVGIVDFSKLVVESCNKLYPGAVFVDYGDPAGRNTFSHPEGGLTSNAKLMEEATGIKIISSENAFSARKEAVDQMLSRIHGVLIDPSCTRLINGFMGGYCYPEIKHSDGGEQIYGEAPIKNRYSHPHDGLQYWFVKLFYSSTKKKPKHEPPSRPAATSPMGWMGV